MGIGQRLGKSEVRFYFIIGKVVTNFQGKIITNLCEI